MVKIILVNKNASLTEKSVKNFELSTLYKKCSLKSEANFEKRHTWNVDGFFYSVYAKDNGRSNSENKYDLPPPVDEELYFNTMAIIKHAETDATNGTVTDLIMSDWDKVYEKLFGGFEDLDHSEELSEDDEEISESEKTKEGYHKDGFVVDDDDEDDEDYVPEEDDLEESDSYNDDSDEEDSEELDSEELEGDSEDEGKESEDEEKESEEEDSEDEYYSELSEDSYCSSEED